MRGSLINTGTFVATTILTSQIITAYPLDARTSVTSIPSGWAYIGCLVDGGGTRILPAASQVVTNNTPQSCITFCVSKGYKLAGLEYTSECWCDNAYGSSAGNVQAAPDSDCSFTCSGDNKQTCGGSNRLQAYKLSGATSSSTTTSTRTTTMTSPTSTTKGKRGLAWPHTNTQNPEIFKSQQISFLYNWGTQNSPGNQDIPYYAMQWSGAGIDQLASAVSASGTKVVLAFNEPDAMDQANMTAIQAASLYKQYIHPLGASGHTLISPAVTNGGAPTGLTWLDQFFAACTNCRVDGIALHWYGGWIDDLVSFVEAAKKYNKPLYLTEFGFSWDADATIDSFTQFFPLAFNYLDNEPAVVKYAFFGAFSDGTPKSMIAADGTLNTLGKLYVS